MAASMNSPQITIPCIGSCDDGALPSSLFGKAGTPGVRYPNLDRAKASGSQSGAMLLYPCVHVVACYHVEQHPEYPWIFCRVANSHSALSPRLGLPRISLHGDSVTASSSSLPAIRRQLLRNPR